MKFKLSISTQINFMLGCVILYATATLALKYIQAKVTLQDFTSMQDKQVKLVSIVDNIKSNLSQIQTLQVQHIVDSLEGINSSSKKPITIDIQTSLKNLQEYANSNTSKELTDLYEKINLRYSLLSSQYNNLNLNEIKDNPEEAILAIEGMIGISKKMDEELSSLILISRTQLKTAVTSIENKIHTRIKRIIFFSIIFMSIFIFIVILFARSIKRKINLLVNGTKAFAENNFDYRIDIPNNVCRDELCDLSGSFNQMAGSIAELIEKQNKDNKILDQKVKEQTSEIRANLKELEKTNTVVMDSINYASKIQHALLPNKEKMKKTMGEHFVIWNQRDIVGGDFYWMEEVENGFIVALIDCTGHGVPGSLMTMISVPTLDRIIREYEISNPAIILSMLNKSLKDMLSKGDDLGDDGLDMGICYVNTVEKTVTFSSAGIPLFYTKNNEIYEIKGDRKGVGYKDTDINYDFREHVIEIDCNMSFYMATDGITEQVGGREKRMMFGRKRLRELLKHIHVKAKYEQKDIILETLSEYRGDEPQKDDMTCISFKIEN